MKFEEKATVDCPATGTGTTPTDWQPVGDWSTLAGSLVEIHHRGQQVDGGVVDCATTDGNILWLIQNGVIPRRIIEKSPDVYVRLRLR